MAMELDRIELLDESERGEQQMEAKCLFGEQPQPDQISPKRDAVNKELPMTVGDAAVDELSVDEMGKFIKGRLSNSFGAPADDLMREDVDFPSMFPGAIDALEKALLKTKAHTEVYKALTIESYSLPSVKARDLTMVLAAELGTANKKYLEHCYIPLVGVLTKELHCLAEMMFEKLPKKADFFISKKNPSNPFRMAPREGVVSLIKLMDEDELKDITTLKPADVWGGIHVWVFALENMSREGFDGVYKEQGDKSIQHALLEVACIDDDMAMSLLKRLLEKYKQNREERKKFTELLQELIKLPLDDDIMIEDYADALLKEGANPLEGDVVAIVAKKGQKFRLTAKFLGKCGVDQLRHQKKFGWSKAIKFFSGLLSREVDEDVVRDILQHAVRCLPECNDVQVDLSEARSLALCKRYYKVLLELLRVQFDPYPIYELIQLAGSGTVEEEFLFQALDLDLTYDVCKKAMCEAADVGLTSLIEEILSRGDTAVLLQQGDGALLIQRALKNEKYATAIALLKDEKNVAIWRSEPNKEVLREELAKLVQTLGEQVTASHGPGGEDEKLKVATVNAILGTCIVGNSIDCKILDTKTEVQLDGKTWTCHNLIGKYHLKEIQKHEVYQTLVGLKWNQYGWAALLINFLLHILFMLVLTGALAFAAESPDPRLYCDRLDWFRLSLEILIIIFTIVFVVLEGLEFINRYRGTKYSHRAQIKRIGKTFYQFFGDWRHVLSFAAIVCTILIIPCRVVDTDWQWRVAAFAFIFNGLRIFEYAVLSTYIGEYTEVLIRMLLQDIPRFALFCIVVVFSLGGGLYFALRGEVLSSANTNSTCSSGAYDTVSETGLGKHRDSTSEIYLPMLHTLRIIAEGSSLDYTEYSWFSILIYWLNVVSVTVILSYLLIAQFTSTYAGLDHAFFDVTLTKADILYRMETGTPPYGLLSSCFDFSDDGKVSMMAQRTYVQFDSKENQVQPVDRKLIHVSTTLREHTAALKDVSTTLRMLREDVKDVDTRIAEAQQREEKLVKILEQLQAKATPEEGITTSEDASPITRTFID